MMYNISENTTLLDFILKIKPSVSKQKAKKFIAESIISIDNKEIKAIPSTQISAGQILNIEKKNNEKIKIPKPDKHKPVVIVFEDSHFIIAVKPAGIISAGKTAGNEKTFHKVLEKYLSTRNNNKTNLWAVHRIDREVEGIIVFAKSDEIKQLFSDNWDKVTKKYLALTENKPQNLSGFIENWIYEGKNLKMFCSEKEIPEGKFAKTEYLYIKQVSQKYHLLEIKLHTGRKNQIRAHMAYINCPIAGDRKYGANADFKRKIRLVAYYLEFNHPISGKRLKFSYEPAKSFYSPSQNSDENYKIL